MVVHHSIDADTLAKRLIAALSDFPGIRGIWITNVRGETTFWVVTDELSSQAEHAFYEATNVLYDEYPGAHWDLHMLNPVYYPAGHDMRLSVPAGAELLKSFRDE